MGFRLHHFYVLTEPDAPEAARLSELGMTEGSRNTHPGQGTANRRFFFHDAYLEFVFFVDETEARTGPGSVFRSLHRFEAVDGSPFGILVQGESEDDVESFPGFPYQPDYFDEGVCFGVGENVDRLSEPNVFMLPLVPPKPARAEPRSAAPFERVSRLRVTTPVTETSQALRWVAGVDRVEIVTGGDHLMEVEFEASVNVCDLRPRLPLILRW